ncbi:MAG: NUDIX domain-containing protein [Candidatus Thorarchaeota archaeon]
MSPDTLWNAAQTNSPVLAVDAVIQLANQGIVFIRRRHPPYKHMWALPGGTVKLGETVEEALIREVAEETGLEVVVTRLIGVFSDPRRDPRGHTVSIAFLATPIGGTLRAASDASQVQIFFTAPEQLAFDHAHILKAAGILKGGADRKTGSGDE